MITLVVIEKNQNGMGQLGPGKKSTAQLILFHGSNVMYMWIFVLQYMFITCTSLSFCMVPTAIPRIRVVVVVVVAAAFPCWRGSWDDMWLTLILEHQHNQRESRHDIWALKFESIIFFHMGSTTTITTTICDCLVRVEGGRFRFTIRHEVSKTSPPVIWPPPTYVATAVAEWIVAISLLRLGPSGSRVFVG